MLMSHRTQVYACIDDESSYAFVCKSLIMFPRWSEKLIINPERRSAVASVARTSYEARNSETPQKSHSKSPKS